MARQYGEVVLPNASTGQSPGTLARKLSQRQATMAQFLQIKVQVISPDISLSCPPAAKRSCLKFESLLVMINCPGVVCKNCDKFIKHTVHFGAFKNVL